MAEFYEAFRADKEEPSLTLLPNTMPMQILDRTFKFVEETSDAATNHVAGQTTPTGPVGLSDTAYDYRSITRRACEDATRPRIDLVARAWPSFVGAAWEAMASPL